MNVCWSAPVKTICIAQRWSPKLTKTTLELIAKHHFGDHSGMGQSTICVDLCVNPAPQPHHSDGVTVTEYIYIQIMGSTPSVNLLVLTAFIMASSPGIKRASIENVTH